MAASTAPTTMPAVVDPLKPEDRWFEISSVMSPSRGLSAVEIPGTSSIDVSDFQSDPLSTATVGRPGAPVCRSITRTVDRGRSPTGWPLPVVTSMRYTLPSIVAPTGG
jgi:hypothetical protein